MPEPLHDPACRDASLRAIVTYKRPCNICCDCGLSPRGLRKQQKCTSKAKKAARKPRRRHRCKRGKRRRRQRCCAKDNSCPQRIEQIALPLNRRLEYTLQKYSSIFDAERVVKVCRLIHELQHPQPRPPRVLKARRRKRRCLRAAACCKAARLKAQWLERQAARSAAAFVRYLLGLRRMVPNYKQLQVTMALYRLLRFRALRTCNRFVKEELKVICQKLAILIDVRLRPYAQRLVVDAISCTTLEDKHCVFEMFAYVPPESEAETELVYEEEEASVVEAASLYAGEDLLLFGELEAEGGGAPLGAEGGASGAGSGGSGDLGGMLTESSGGEEAQSTRSLRTTSHLSAASGGGGGAAAAEEEAAAPSEEGSIQLASAMGEEEGAWGAGYEEDLSLMLGPSTADVTLADFHPAGTSSYVDWCLYVSWLKELGRNIEMYASCLQQFRAAIAADRASKHADAIRFILKNWSDYLRDSRRVDTSMTQYFKDKPMTWCSMCRDCSIDDYPLEHYIPPELAEAVKTTKQWRRLLAEAEEYCNLLSAKGAEEEGVCAAEEAYEIFDVTSSSSSSFDILPLDDVGGRRSKSK